MTDETDTPDSGTDNVIPSEPDTAPEWDYYDPDEDQDTEVVQEAATDEGPEPADEETPEEDDEPIEAVVDRIKAENPKLAAHIAELEQGALRQADYTRKAQEVATRRKALEADVSRLEGIANAFIDHLTQMVPEAPDPALAFRDPNKYVAMEAQHKAAVAQVQRLIEIGTQPKKIAETMSQADRETLLRDENARLMERFPVTRSEKGRMEFFRAAASAAEELGYSAEELGQQTDHRAFALAYWARKGMDAAKSKDKAADAAKGKEKVAAAPRRPSLQSQAAAAAKNREAMKRLSKTGSLKDALAIDWD
jgi:hypothetical protein